MSDTSQGEVIITSIDGYCPVEADGTVDGELFYFRARGRRWSMGIGGDDAIMKPNWYYEEQYGAGPFAAGWMSEDEARAFIDKAAGLYRAEMLNTEELTHS